MANDPGPQIIHRLDYKPPDHRVTDIDLTFEINDGGTQVTAELRVVRDHPDARDLVLDGSDLELLSVAVDGRLLSGNEYRVDAESLTVYELPAAARVTIVTRIHPEKNTALEGLYRSGGMYCTQCEAEGFRKITYFPDRPDILARYKTTIVADKTRNPVMLSNGNLIADEVTADGRRRVTWQDPFPKPSYLFALVAGDLQEMRDTFVTKSGRRVDLRIYSEPHNIDQCDFAMDALKRAMRWDEEVYGREYDLDIFMIVAVEDFNMGAMENKGLNVFNTSCVLATPDTATDAGYQRVEGVVAHEYFHNWSGNRVTCRDWFQLSLKEGFTVFRDSQFSGDAHSTTVQRIEAVEFLRTVQFPEDSGPMAHPVRPESYIEISNFYTPTVYEKGAEVVRMMHTLLGAERFRRGTDLYFDRHDGQAVTTDDFVAAMEDANGVDFSQFRRWYQQAGTPIVRVERAFHDGVLELRLRQSCPATPGQPEKKPFHIPFAFGLLDEQGAECLGPAAPIEADARLEHTGDGTVILHLMKSQATLRIGGLSRMPAVSALRGFSAPVRLEFERPRQELEFLVINDSDGFSRWDAMRALQVEQVEFMRQGGDVRQILIDLYGSLLDGYADGGHTPERVALLAEILDLPTEAYLSDLAPVIDVAGIHGARQRLRAAIGAAHVERWRGLLSIAPKVYSPDASGMALRRLCHLALSYLCAAVDEMPTLGAEMAARLLSDIESADNLTRRLALLRGIIDATWIDDADRTRVLDAFYERWQGERLVIDQWFSLQASSPRGDALARVIGLERHPRFDQRNPNRVRALYGAFASQNAVSFHREDGAGYAFLAERIASLDATNPQLAARLLTPLTRPMRYPPALRTRMIAALESIHRGQRSKDVFEVVSKSLQAVASG
jgi:aminopeptidase N